MATNNSEISTIIKQQLKNYQENISIDEVGHVEYVGDGVARVSGLAGVVSNELVAFENDVFGLAQNIEMTEVGVVVFGSLELVKEGQKVKRTHQVMDVPVGKELIGRVVNAIGQPIDGQGDIDTAKKRPIEVKAPGVMQRKSVFEPLQTGIKAIDSLVPIGRGQRELIIGDRKTGKTSIAIDTILNQKGKDIVVVYVAIGQKDSTLREQVEVLRQNGAMNYTIVVSAGPSEPASMLYLAPYAGTAMGEEFMYNGQHVLIVYDDLTKHANAYRELSLILRRPPGREAYPGDIFYLHSRLLERSAKLSDELGGGSMTALPIIETQAGDVSAYIPTNVISITDGQIFLDADEFYAGNRPAIDAGTSVSRVGGDAQIKAMKKVSSRLRLDLASYKELEAFSQFGSDLDQVTQQKLKQGQLTVAAMNQPVHASMDVAKQVVIFFALTNGFFNDVDIKQVQDFENDLITYFEENSIGSEILQSIDDSKDIENPEKLKEALNNFVSARNLGNH